MHKSDPGPKAIVDLIFGSLSAWRIGRHGYRGVGLERGVGARAALCAGAETRLPAGVARGRSPPPRAVELVMSTSACRRGLAVLLLGACAGAGSGEKLCNMPETGTLQAGAAASTTAQIRCGSLPSWWRNRAAALPWNRCGCAAAAAAAGCGPCQLSTPHAADHACSSVRANIARPRSESRRCALEPGRLASTASVDDRFYVGAKIQITGGTGAGASSVITKYCGQSHSQCQGLESSGTVAGVSFVEDSVQNEIAGDTIAASTLKLTLPATDGGGRAIVAGATANIANCASRLTTVPRMTDYREAADCTGSMKGFNIYITGGTGAGGVGLIRAGPDL
jgi:hypothetical protein